MIYLTVSVKVACNPPRSKIFDSIFILLSIYFSLVELFFHKMFDFKYKNKVCLSLNSCLSLDQIFGSLLWLLFLRSGDGDSFFRISLFRRMKRDLGRGVIGATTWEL